MDNNDFAVASSLVHSPKKKTGLIIGIVGMGTVGRALYEGFLSKGFKVLCNDVIDLDSALIENSSKERLVMECDVIFICVQTGSLADGACDLTHVAKAFEELWGLASRLCVSPVIAIKSTCIPGTVDSFGAGYPMICSNPEFMRRNTAVEDFLSPDRIIIGAKTSEVHEIMAQVYEDWDVPILHYSPKVAEAIKYLSNAYLVGKVAFAEEIMKMSEMLRVSPMELFYGVTLDHRINESHLHPVMGKISLNSPCLVKDLKALIVQLEKSGHDSKLLKAYFHTGIESELEGRLMKVVTDFFPGEEFKALELCRMIQVEIEK